MRTPQTRSEELANALTHGLGIPLSVTALVVLLAVAAPADDPRRLVGLSIFGVMLIVMYLISTVYHAVRSDRTKRRLRRFDQSAIFLLIAGTYTPVLFVHMRGAWGWVLFGVVWALALFGITLRWVAAKSRFHRLHLVLYLTMGWLSLLVFQPLTKVIPLGLFLWLLVGGLCYSAGVVVYRMRRLRFHHSVWHLFVLAGSACHFFGLLFHTA